MIVRACACCIVFLLALSNDSCVTSASGQELAKEYYNLGNAYYAIKRYKDAIECYQKSLAYDVGAAKALFNMANAYIALGNPDKAIEILSGLIAKDQRNIELYSLLAYAHHRKGNDDNAVAVYLKILSIQPEDRDSLYNLGVIFRAKKEYAKAEGYFRTLLRTDTDDRKALYALGSLLLEAGKAQEAVGFLNQYLELKPEDAAAYLVLASAYSRLAQYLKALDSYEKAVAVDKTLADAWFFRAEILLTKVQDPDKGVTSLEQALELGYGNMSFITALVQAVAAGPLHDDEKNRVYVLLKKKNLMPAVDTSGRK